MGMMTKLAEQSRKQMQDAKAVVPPLQLTRMEKPSELHQAATTQSGVVQITTENEKEMPLQGSINAQNIFKVTSPNQTVVPAGLLLSQDSPIVATSAFVKMVQGLPKLPPEVPTPLEQHVLQDEVQNLRTRLHELQTKQKERRLDAQAVYASDQVRYAVPAVTKQKPEAKARKLERQKAQTPPSHATSTRKRHAHGESGVSTPVLRDVNGGSQDKLEESFKQLTAKWNSINKPLACDVTAEKHERHSGPVKKQDQADKENRNLLPFHQTSSSPPSEENVPTISGAEAARQRMKEAMKSPPKVKKMYQKTSGYANRYNLQRRLGNEAKGGPGQDNQTTITNTKSNLENSDTKKPSIATTNLNLHKITYKKHVQMVERSCSPSKIPLCRT